jgi:hypothetical protein
VDDSAEWFALPGNRRFFSLFGLPLSLSDPGDKNRFAMFLSFVAGGVVTGSPSPRGLDPLGAIGPISSLRLFDPVGVAGDTFSTMCPPFDGALATLDTNVGEDADSVGLNDEVGLDPGDLFDGRVLLRLTPIFGLPGVDFFDETETLRRMPPFFLKSSAAALAFEADRLTTLPDRAREVGVFGALI